MATVEGQDQINIEADVHRDGQDSNDDNGDTIGTAQVTGGARGGAAGGGAGGAGPTSFNLRVELNKILEFFGTKSKDTISAADFICRLEDLAKTNRWSDAQSYYHFANSLRNPAREWLLSVVDWDDNEHDQPLWSDFKEIFKQEYAVQTNESLILEGLANLAMKPNEMTNELLSRITRAVRVIKESFENYRAITPDLLNDINHGISNQTFRTFKHQFMAMMFNFFKMNLFKAALTPELRAVVAQQDQEQMTVKKMYMHATTAQREGKTKPPAAINKINEDNGTVEAADNKNDVAAFNRKGARPKTNQSSRQSRGGYTSG
jgi:Ty3 transposon capsid-like protein